MRESYDLMSTSLQSIAWFAQSPQTSCNTKIYADYATAGAAAVGRSSDGLCY